MSDPLSRQPGQTGYPPPYTDQQSGYPMPQPGQPGIGFQPPPGQYSQPGYQPQQGYSPHPGQGYQPPGQGYQPPGQQGYQPPGQQGYQPPGQQGYQPPGQQGYQPPGQQGYQPPVQQGYQPPGYQPIAQQPQGTAGDPGGWMNMPLGTLNVPPGLEYLTSVDQLLVHQKVELLEAFTGFETKNKYTVKNSMGQKVFYAVEDSDCCTRNCCGPMRPFDMKILDNFKNEVIHLNRPLACDSCWFPCCLQTMEVSSPPGTTIGSIEQEWSILTPQFKIKNAAGDVVLRIEGPFCTFTMCGDVEFKLMSKDGSSQVGKISKQWAGLLREAFTDADYFGITFPMDMDVRMKAVMLGACFLIDAMFFEKQANRESDRPGMF